MKNTLYIVSLGLLTTIIWVQLYSAQFLEYDVNFYQLFYTFLLSLAILVAAVVLLIRKTEVVRKNLTISIAFLVVNSPLTIYWVVMNYQQIFGADLKIG